MYNRASLLVCSRSSRKPPGLFFKNLQPISVGAGVLGYPGRNRQSLETAGAGGFRGDIQEVLVLIRRNIVLFLLAVGKPKCGREWGQRRLSYLLKIELKSLILAQIERWRHALHMQVERQRGGNPGGERRTGE